MCILFPAYLEKRGYHEKAWNLSLLVTDLLSVINETMLSCGSKPVPKEDQGLNPMRRRVGCIGADGAGMSDGRMSVRDSRDGISLSMILDAMDGSMDV